MVTGPFVIMEDDSDDQEIMREVFDELGVKNKVIFFSRCNKAFEFLTSSTEQPFLILCDINLPNQNGMEFKSQIDENPQLRQKSIPFVFFSTSVNKKYVDAAYKEFTVQGYFKKEDQYQQLKRTIQVIIDYWSVCKHPNS